ncbi:hypothetical protein TNCV_4502371, partial [Trichonephila clavipes]
TCILNIPNGTELQVNGGIPVPYTFVRIKDGFLYNPWIIVRARLLWMKWYGLVGKRPHPD